MTDTESYEGWANRETWALALWLNNDQGFYERALELAGDRGATARDVGENIKTEMTTLLDPNAYRDEFGSAQPEALALVAAEVGSLWRINWDEIGADFLNAAQENENAR